MPLHTEWIRYGDKGHLTGYLARPDRGLDHQPEGDGGFDYTAPAVIVVQEIWGVDAHIQDVTRRLAQAGYIAFAPDLLAIGGNKPEELSEARVAEAQKFLNSFPSSLWRDPEAQQAQLAKLPAEHQQRVSVTLPMLLGISANLPRYIEPLKETFSFLQNEYAFSKGQGIASVGFCMGGALSALLAAEEPSLKGAVIFYGNSPASDSIPAIQCPLLGIYGELDPRISDNVPAFADQMKAADKPFEYHIYKNAQHAFFNDTRPTYDMNASRDAYSRTLLFLNKVFA